MINPNDAVALLSTQSTIPQGNALEMRNRRANYFRDKQNKEALKGLGKSLELEPDNAKPSK